MRWTFRARVLIIVAPVAAVAFTIACGESDDTVATPAPSEVLELRGFNITAANFRDAVVTAYVDTDPAFCAAIQDLSPAEAIDRLDEELGLSTARAPLPNATPVSDVARRSRDDELQAARIVLDECDTNVASSTDAPEGEIPTPAS